MVWVRLMHATRTASTSVDEIRAKGAEAKAVMECQPGYIDSNFSGNPISRNIRSVSRWNSEAELDAASAVLKPYDQALLDDGYIEHPAVITKHPEPVVVKPRGEQST